MWWLINWLLIRYKGPGSEVPSIGIYLFHRPCCTSVGMAKPLFASFPYLRAGSIVIRWWENARCHLLNITDSYRFHNCRKNLYVHRWIWHLGEPGNNHRNKVLNEQHFFFLTKFVIGMGVQKHTNTSQPKWCESLLCFTAPQYKWHEGCHRECLRCCARGHGRCPGAWKGRASILSPRLTLTYFNDV